MDFTAKYTTSADALNSENKDKKVIGDDAYAIGEVISDLIKMINFTKHHA